MRSIIKTIVIFITMLPFAYANTEQDVIKSVFVNEAIISTYTFSASNQIERQKEIARYFTASGWANYSQALLKSGLLKQVLKNNYQVSAVALKPPSLSQAADGQFRASMPILVVYQNPQYEQQQTLNVEVTFISTHDGTGMRGMALTSLVSKPVTAPLKCEPIEVKQ